MTRVIVVLGMHRSGTSLLAQILGRLGIKLGDDILTDPAADNKYGYWEHHGIAMTQDFLLAELGRMWHEPRGVLKLPDGWLESAPACHAMQVLSDMVRREVSEAAGHCWGFKDPRTVRLLPMWERIFSACGVTPVYILAVRRPDSVVASLARRNGMAADQARFLWLQHVVEPFRIGVPVAATVDYDRWFDRPERNLGALLRAIGVAMTLQYALEQCAPVLDRDERHHASCGGAFSADRVYGLVTGNMPGVVRRYRLRRVAAELDRAMDLLDAWVGVIERCRPAGPLPVAAWERRK